MGHHKKHHKHKHQNEDFSQLDLNNVDMSQIQNIMQNIDINQLNSLLSNLNIPKQNNNFTNLNYPQNNVIAVLSALKPFLPEHRCMIIDKIIESLSNITF